MRRARLRTTVNLAAAQNRRRQVEKPGPQELTGNTSGTQKNPSDSTVELVNKEINETQQEGSPLTTGTDPVVTASEESIKPSHLETKEPEEGIVENQVDKSKNKCENVNQAPINPTKQTPNLTVSTSTEITHLDVSSSEEKIVSETLDGTSFSEMVLDPNTVKQTESIISSVDSQSKDPVGY